MFVVGIDPGVSGAVGQISGGAVSVQDVPTFETRVGKTLRRRLDLAALAEMFRGLAMLGPDLVVIEQVNGMPRDGGSRAFEFGYTAGALAAMAAACMLPYQLVPSVVWKGAMRVKDDKDGARLIASRLFPEAAHNWRRAKDHNRAEAVLIAEYGRRHILRAAA